MKKCENCEKRDYSETILSFSCCPLVFLGAEIFCANFVLHNANFSSQKVTSGVAFESLWGRSRKSLTLKSLLSNFEFFRVRVGWFANATTV